MKTAVRVVMAVAALGTIVHAAQFKDTYRAPGIEAQDFAGKKVAALVITGDQDGVVPPGIAEVAAKLLPRGKLAVMQGCGHAPFIEDRATYKSLLHGFLKEIAG